MAYNLESLVNILKHILHPDCHCYWTLDPSKKPEIESLLKKAFYLKERFEKISPVTSDEIESLACRIRDAAHEAEYILESQMVDQILDSIRLRFMISPQGLQGVIAEFDSAVDDIKKILQDDGSQSLGKSLPAVSPMADPIPKNILVGIDQVSTQLKDQLTGQQSKLVIIPIVGMGGIGKTTLARNVYDNPFVVSHFCIRACNTISQHQHKDENNLKKILLALLGCVFGGLRNEMLQKDNDELGESLREKLTGRRYLLVLDDMWVTDDWDDIKRFLPDDKNGSRIMVTTRETYVANYTRSNSSHIQMQLLNEDESWNLLRHKVFGQETCPPELKDIGKIIAKNCGGLPLAVHVIGGVLSQGKRTVEYWSQVANDVSSNVAAKDEKISKILSLSYNHLPIHLKPCFLYMGAFLEDAEIRRSRLIRLWVAEGFLKPIPDKSLEEAAGLYLKALVDRNLIYVGQKESNGIVKSYTMHDFLRDLCVRKASEEKFLHDMNGQISYLPKDIICLGRVIVNSSYDVTRSACSLAEVLKTRAGSLLHTDYKELKIFPLFYGLRLLKVLDILGIKLSSLPDEMLLLINLRYLAFWCNSHVSFKIASLENLETIIFQLEDTLSLAFFSVPSLSSRTTNAILDMPRLRHFETKMVRYHCEYPDGECSVKENLQSLSEIEIDKGFVQLLNSVPNLKKLGVCYYAAFSSDSIDLSCLLKLEAFKCRSRYSHFTSEISLIFFIFPPFLKKVTLIKCELQAQHLKVIGNLPNLKVLKLRHCGFPISKWEPVEGQFKQLQFLLLQWLNLVNWVADETSFPSLERLVIRYCSKLEGIPIGIGDIATLETIEVNKSSDSAMDSARKIQQKQLESGNYNLQVCITDE